MKIVIASGGFDPIHSGHIKYLNSARELGDILIVGVNSDAWLSRKKGREFLSRDERFEIVRNLKCVGQVLDFDDSDGSAIDLIRKVREEFPNGELIFANGGDRTEENIPEMIFSDVKFVFGVGGYNKMNSSSWILDAWKAPKVNRIWGSYRIVYEDDAEKKTTKVKELIVNPGKSLSMQKHMNRSEFWHVTSGFGKVLLNGCEHFLAPHTEITINNQDWHKLYNITNDIPLKIIEVQYGTVCEETDIVRAD